MTFIIKSGTSGYTAEVDNQNRVQVFSTAQTEPTARAILGDSYNINTGTITLTSATTSALMYLKNTDTVTWTLSRVFYNADVSTGGSGGWLAEVAANPTAGTLISAGVSFDPVNFNFGSAKELTSICLKGAEGSTATGGTQGAVSTIIPASGSRVLIPFDSVILEPGSSMAILVTPPAGNTSMDIQVGVNLHREA
jgi:hypothetical protein